jgi:type IX secretion system substrate protein
MGKYIYILFFTFLMSNVRSQNLVPNPSFEDHYDCTMDAYYMENVPYWEAFWSVDYYNACVVADSMSVSIFDVPENEFGYQYAKRGAAYAGFATYVAANYREHVYTQLMQPLSANKKYCIQFSVSLSDSSTWAINKIGAFLSPDTLYPKPFEPTATPPYNIFTYYIPQIESTSLITDSSIWRTISGVFQAQGGEKYITIGNFRDDNSTDTLRIQTRISTDRFSYYYIDDVSVYEQPDVFAGNDTIVPPGGSTPLGILGRPDIIYSWSPATGLSDPAISNPVATPGSTTTYVLTVTDTSQYACTNSFTDSVLVQVGFIGINENTNEWNIQLYPNPNDGNMILTCDLKPQEEGVLNVYDVIGKFVKGFNVPSGTKTQLINAEDLEAGMYVYEVIVNDKKVKKDKFTIIK